MGFYDRLASTGRQKVEDAESKRKAGLEAYLKSRNLADEQIKEENDLLTGKSGRGDSASNYQVLSRQNADGTVEQFRYNKLTGEMTPIPGSKGFAPHYIKDPVTGAIVQAIPGGRPAATGTSGSGVGGGQSPNPLAPSGAGNGGQTTNTPKPASDSPFPAGSPNDIQWQAERAGKRVDAETTRDIADQENFENSALEFEARTKMVDKLRDLRKRASKGLVGGAGSVGGRITNMMPEGMSNHLAGDPKAVAELRTILGKNQAQIIKDISGATVPDAERKTLMQFIPKITDDDNLFEANLNDLLRESAALNLKYAKKAGKAPAAKQPAPSNGDVVIMTKDGRQFRVPKAMVDKAKAQGAQEVK
jgi:hypothetical protein